MDKDKCYLCARQDHIQLSYAYIFEVKNSVNEHCFKDNIFLWLRAR